MILGIGFDLIDINELQADIDEKRERWLQRVFTDAEREYCAAQPDPYRHFAGTLAAKEAAMKALGTGWTDDADWQQIEIIRESGKPILSFRGSVLEFGAKMTIRGHFVSITHTKDYAAAVVVLES